MAWVSGAKLFTGKHRREIDTEGNVEANTLAGVSSTTLWTRLLFQYRPDPKFITTEYIFSSRAIVVLSHDQGDINASFLLYSL